MNSGTKSICIENAEHYRWGDGCDGWHLLKREEMSVIQERMPPGTSEKMHYHKLSRQFFFILDGTATMDVNGDRLVLEHNQGIEIPPGVFHQLRNESTGELSFLVFSAPKSHGDGTSIEGSDLRRDVARGRRISTLLRSFHHKINKHHQCLFGGRLGERFQALSRLFTVKLRF